MESQCVVHLQFLGSVGLVPEEVQMSVGVFRVPRPHILCESRVEHIAHDIVAMMADRGFHLLAEQWRHHFDGLLLVVIILTYGQGQLGSSTYAGDAGEELQHALGQERPARHLEVGMQKEILVSHADHGNAHTKELAGNAAEHFIKVDDKVGSALLDDPVHHADARYIRRHQGDIIGYGAQQIEPAVVLRRTEVGTVELLNPATYLILKKRRNHPILALSYQNLHYLVTFVSKHLSECQRLGEMSSSLALYHKNYLHFIFLTSFFKNILWNHDSFSSCHFPTAKL